MDKNNINLNTPRNTVSNTSPAPASQRAARAAVEPGNNSPEIAAELQNSPQVADPHYTRLMRLLALPNQDLSADELIHLFSKIENKDLQKKAYTKILESSNLSPEEKAKFTAVIQDPAISEQKQAVDRALNGSLSFEERYIAARSIKDVQEQEKAFCAIVASIKHFYSSDLRTLQKALQGLPQSFQDGVFYAVAGRRIFVFAETMLELIESIQDTKKREKALRKFALSQLPKESPCLSKCLGIAKLIHKQDLQQKALYAIWEQGRNNLHPITLNATLEAYSLLSPDLQNPALRIELLESYFAKCKEFNEEAMAPLSGIAEACNLRSFKELIQNVFDSANEEEKSMILFRIAKNINIEGSFNYLTEELFKEIHNRCSKELQKEFAYTLLKQTLKPNDYREPLSPYILVLETFMPVSSVCEDDIDGLIDNVLSKEQPSFTVTQNEYGPPEIIVDPLYEDPFYHDYRNGKSTFQDMYTAVLDLYMPSGQISLKKKNRMIETMACNQSLSKDFRKVIIKKYIQDPALAADLLYIVDQDLSDKRFKKTKLAARDEEQS